MGVLHDGDRSDGTRSYTGVPELDAGVTFKPQDSIINHNYIIYCDLINIMNFQQQSIRIAGAPALAGRQPAQEFYEDHS